MNDATNTAQLVKQAEAILALGAIVRNHERIIDRQAETINALARIVRELADHAYWQESRGANNPENRADLRSLKVQADLIFAPRSGE